MLANYNGKTYWYISSRRKKEIVTRTPDKAENDFKRDNDLFFKNISEEELIDIFDVEFWVEYDANLPNTPLMWKISNENSELENGKIMLRFAEGILPEWEIEEKNVCVKHIEVSEVRNAKVIYVYKKKDGKELDTPQKEEINLSLDELITLCKQYKRTSL